MLVAPVVLIGVGELAGVFARGLLRGGYPLYPVRRNTDVQAVADTIHPPRLVLVTVAEDDLQAVLQALPQRWRDRVGLVQNELLPQDWCKHDIVHPTITVVWFEKKPGQDYKVILPSLVYGPQAGLITGALRSLHIPCRKLTTQQDLLFELVRKNLYILTTNIAGLVSGGTVADLWTSHRALAQQVAQEVLDVQRWPGGTDAAPNRDTTSECVPLANRRFRDRPLAPVSSGLPRARMSLPLAPRLRLGPARFRALRGRRPLTRTPLFLPSLCARSPALTRSRRALARSLQLY